MQKREKADSNHRRLLLVIDLGSSSVRCSITCNFANLFTTQAYDFNGNALDHSLHQVVLQLQEGKEDPRVLETATEEAVDHCIKNTKKIHKHPKFVAMGFSCFGMNIMGLDEENEPITAVYTYATSETVSAASELRKTIEQSGKEKYFYDRTGVPIHSAYAPALFWHLHSSKAKEDQLLLAKVKKWSTVPTYLLSKWCRAEEAGTFDFECPVSTCEASWTGLLNRHTLKWDNELLDLVQVPMSSLPPVVDISESPNVRLGKEYQKRWPELEKTKFFLALGDGAAANLGSLCDRPDRLCVTVGTSAALRVVLPRSPGLQIPDGLWLYTIDKKRVLVGGALTDGGSLHRYFVHLLGLPEDRKKIDAAVQAVPPGSDGVQVMPFLRRTERSPGWLLDARCCLLNLQEGHSREHILRAVYEAVGIRLAMIADQIQRAIPQENHASLVMIASGGSLEHSRAWREIISHCANLPMRMYEMSETTSRGVAILMLEMLGEPVSPHEESVKLDEQIQPDAKLHERYLKVREEHESIYKRLFINKL